MTDLAFHRDAYLAELDTEVVEVGEADGRPWAITADTVFYPEGGGQPADRGVMGAARVIDVQRRDGQVVHVVTEPLHRGPVHQRLDWHRRYDHMQQHSAQHLLTAVADVWFGWPTTAFHLGAQVSDIELDVPAIEMPRIAELENVVAREIRAARPITARPLDDLVDDVRTRGLPDELDARLRVVEIEGLDRNTCGGTHLRSTAEIGCLALLGTESMRGGTRLTWVAGDRVRHRLEQWERRGAELRQVLGAANDELADVTRLKLDQIKDLRRQLGRRTDALADAVAERLAHASTAVVTARIPDADVDLLRRIGSRLNRLRPAGVSVLTTDSDGDGVFVVAVGPESGIDTAMAGDTVRMAFGGTGGGAKGIYQGTAPNLDRAEVIFQGLEALLGLG
jgi:alanyl-tRNA synthetase